MKAPASMVYWKDWCTDIALRRCSWAAQGVLPHVVLLLHNSDEYGVLRWPLSEIASTAGVPVKYLRELAAKNVLKGGDSCDTDFMHTPNHAGRSGEPVTLVKADGGSCWFLARLVRDNWQRQQRGKGSRFTSDRQPSRSPTRRVGDESVNGLAFAVAFDSIDTYERTDGSIGPAGELARALRCNGYPKCSGTHPDLVAAAAEGITPQELIDATKGKPGKGIGYIVQRARGRREDAKARQQESSEGSNVVLIDPAVKAQAEAQQWFDAEVRRIRNDCDQLEIISPEERDQRIEQARETARRKASGAAS